MGTSAREWATMHDYYKDLESNGKGSVGHESGKKIREESFYDPTHQKRLSGKNSNPMVIVEKNT